MTVDRSPALETPAAPVGVRTGIACRPRLLEGRRAIEEYIDRLNRASPVAERRILGWMDDAPARFLVGAVANIADPCAPEVFLGECRLAFGLSMATRSPAAAPDSYAIGLPLSGQVSVTIGGREVVAHAGEGVIVEPGEVEHTVISPGAHFIEFHITRAELARLAIDWAPGLDARHPRFAAHVAAPLAQRLLFMATQASHLLESDAPPAATAMMYRRWTEMIALTLQHEQAIVNARGARSAAGPAPASVRRAVDFIQAHADSAIGLADIAQAACTSVSSLLRHFESHVGYSPTVALRRVRLERARADLRANPPEAIRDIALRWGFQNAGKFSAAYLSEFGELPSAARAHRREPVRPARDSSERPIPARPPGSPG